MGLSENGKGTMKNDDSLVAPGALVMSRQALHGLANINMDLKKDTA